MVYQKATRGVSARKEIALNKYTKIRDFHGERARGVGSSDIPILAGLSRQYKNGTTLALWEQKTGRAELWNGNARTAWGHKLEGMVLREFIANRYGEEAADQFITAKRRGKSIGPWKTDTECRHPERTYCLAHADLLVDSPSDDQADAYIVEAKTTGMMAGKRREGHIFSGYDPDDLTAQGIPDSVYLQVQWQMYVYGVRLAWVAVLIDTADYREYGPIVADPRVQEKCLALAERFWNHVEADTPPAPETWDDVAKLWPGQTDTTKMVAGDEEARVREMVQRDKVLAARVKEIETEREDIENAIGILIGENAVLASAEGDVLAKRAMSTPRASIAPSKVEKQEPDLFKKLQAAGLVSLSESKPTLKY
jgi:predicted phage-related endonuclease